MTHRIVIVGGGLAGMAALTALLAAGERPLLLEAKRRLGGRAGSFEDSETTESLDHCQHAAMGCCVNFLDFLQRNGALDSWRIDRSLRFYSATGASCTMRRAALPAPLHFAWSFANYRIVSLVSRIAIARGVWNMLRTPSVAFRGSVAQWLEQAKQPREAIERFWEPIFVSALGDTLERSGYFAARKVMLDGFLAHRRAADVWLPLIPLGELYEQMLPRWISQGTTVRTSTAAASLIVREGKLAGVRTSDGEVIEAERVIAALPPRAAVRLLSGTPETGEIVGRYDLANIAFAPITGVHMWFDRPIFNEPHAVLTGRLSQWVFRREGANRDEFAYQVVISASYGLAGRDRESILKEVLGDLQAVFADARAANLLRSKIITQSEAVFSPSIENEKRRPPQDFSSLGLALAGDWTDTKWPATMESAVRSGYLAAEAILASLGKSERFLVPDLPRSRLLLAK